MHSSCKIMQLFFKLVIRDEQASHATCFYADIFVNVGLLQQLKPIKLARGLIERDSRITAARSIG